MTHLFTVLQLLTKTFYGQLPAKWADYLQTASMSRAS